MSPLPEHGRKASLVADVVKVILDRLGQNYEAFIPITIELPEIGGIEPDYCFYIDNWQAAVGKNRINWETDPPLDLVIEIDVTSYTEISDYLLYCIPEVWLIKDDRLEIHGLQQETFLIKDRSQFFPDLEISKLVSECLDDVSTIGSGAAIRELRKKIFEVT